MGYLGIDLGTSGVKVVLVDDDQRVIDQVSAPLSVSRPQPLWSEQNPEDWWTTVQAAMRAMKALRPGELSAVKAVGLAGQMHGAVLLDAARHVLRPAILWNDGRSGEECEELERRVPESRRITGNRAMPGFTAPKLLWIAKHEPEVFRRVDKVLLPKDYVRLMMCGNFASDMSDAAGTLWMDVGRRQWSPEMLEASRLRPSMMPELFEGSRATGEIEAGIARSWGLPRSVLVAAGGGDNAAGAVGAGVVRPGQALISLGTSGVYFTAEKSFRADPGPGVHAFCHCLPGSWHRMSVILSAASCLTWVARATGAADAASLLAEIEAAAAGTATPLFLPYLSGERTPHNDSHARGVFHGLTHDTTRADLGRAVLEGVAFAFADGQQALGIGRDEIHELNVIGGGTRSALWGRVLASALGRALCYRRGGESGPAFGAARLARLAHGGEPPESVCVPPEIDRVVEPDPAMAEVYRAKLAAYRALYQDLKSGFQSAAQRAH